MATDEVAHVLDDAQHRDVDLAEHGQPFPGVDESDVLWRGHDHRTVERHLLGQGQLGVAGARREIDDHEVERAPVHVGEELIERLHDHRTAPDDRRVGVGDETERHRLDAVTLHRNDLLGALIDLRAPLDPQHHLLGGAIDVGVEKSDREAEGAEGQREIGRDRRLADAPFARRHRHFVAHAGKHAGLPT